nr:hypothetical protein Iba_chr06bCG10710 [Ipomoea batatas]
MFLEPEHVYSDGSSKEEDDVVLLLLGEKQRGCGYRAPAKGGDGYILDVEWSAGFHFYIFLQRAKAINS